nr:hypothetical protein [Tanacetum cinerariifolium]
MVVGQQIAFRAHDHRRTQARFHATLFRQIVTEETTELRVFEQRMIGFVVDHLGRVQVGDCGRSTAHGVGVGHRTLLDEGGLRGLLQVD